jgi:hypothetical protein
MKMNFFGDSYDIIKKFLIKSIAPNAEWIALPMFTDEVSSKDIKSIEQFLHVRIVSKAKVTATTDRNKYFAESANHRHIFIDPDTGISIKKHYGKNSPYYVFGPELVSLCMQNPERLLLVFDQSIQRGKADQVEESIERKLTYFIEQNIFCFAYKSHACFMVLSLSSSVCKKAYDNLLDTNLPNSKLTRFNSEQISDHDGTLGFIAALQQKTKGNSSVDVTLDI